jgi:hypothetical protein
VTETALLDRVQALRSAVTQHKSAIRMHREQLAAAKAALEALEQDCRRFGIGLTVHTEGDAHGAHSIGRSGNRS